MVAKRSRNHRFHARYDRIYRPDMLWRAWREVRANGGSAGVDGFTLEEVERQGVAEFLHAIAQDWRAESYRPQPVLRGRASKPDGRQRPLGLPTVCASCISFNRRWLRSPRVLRAAALASSV